MPLHPELRVLTDAVLARSPTKLSVVEKREQQRMAAAEFAKLIEAGPLAATEDHRVAVPGGEITVRLYRPSGTGPRPVHLYLHGGGFWRGGIDQLEFSCHWLVHDVGCAVASVGYRLAPEHPFPTGPEDSYGALSWISANAAALNLDPNRISVGGGSAGASLAAAVALMARDRGGPAIVGQLLEMPTTDLTLSHPSIEQYATGYMLTKASLQECVDFYLSDPADARHPYASPIFAPDVSGLPPTLITTSEFDPLRDEGEAYGERLRAAGVPVQVWRWGGHIHGSVILNRLLPGDAQAYRSAVSQFLGAAFA